MSNTVIKVESLSKQYRLGQVGRKSLSHDINRWWYGIRGKEDPYLKIGEENDRSKKGSTEYVWALQDINFAVQQGEVLGIIGRNGAGKSTLLKILSKVTAPTTGNVKIKGRIASLLEVGTGFHPDLSGRDNIFLNGAILGMTKKEITAKFDEIVDFAGVERYIDTPVKRYSSGMYVRLAFAVAAHLEPEILIVDEVLAVGDAEFQKKCLGKMKDVSEKDGRTVLFVSHNIAAVKTLCTQGLLLENGLLSVNATAEEAIRQYQQNTQSIISNEALTGHVMLEGPGLLELVCKSKSYDTATFLFGEAIQINMHWHFIDSLKSRVISLRIYNTADELMCGFNTLYDKYITSMEESGSYYIALDIVNTFAPGTYYISAGSYIRPHTNEFIYNKVAGFEISEEPKEKDILPNIMGGPKFYSPFSWVIKKQ
ncbi:ABC transporter ATP-binding protein [Panacibacter ginsenosidivorans]|uniref:ABC transporter ATP-binding protein n=1 Tax=Panacibacter ginsenosidivorans TaxID=1813871 RepID=A0A5B8VCP4_9BACT|nr:ABC transporter ATP-binding protein [Panacibacter ginsenosidivorans]QEC69072.1 ABC transporter ATP-binding protein [Panacibacter ginsenosidivorans]